MHETKAYKISFLLGQKVCYSYTEELTHYEAMNLTSSDYVIEQSHNVR